MTIVPYYIFVLREGEVMIDGILYLLSYFVHNFAHRTVALSSYALARAV